MAGPTGLEPATSGVTGRRSNQLNYSPAKNQLSGGIPTAWWEVRDLNPRPPACKAGALTAELTSLCRQGAPMIGKAVEVVNNPLEWHPPGTARAPPALQPVFVSAKDKSGVRRPAEPRRSQGPPRGAGPQ